MVSVIIPTYNSGNYLSDAVESAIEQDIDKEIIIVNDCSNDGSVDILIDNLKKKYNVKDISSDREADAEEETAFLNCHIMCGETDIRIYDMSENNGVACARNLGVRMSKGDYIAFLDADDIWKRGKLVRQVNVLERTGAVLCNTSRELIRPDGRTTGIIIHTPKRITLRNLERTNCINCSSVLVRREAALKYPMEHSDAHEDYLTWLRMLTEYEYAAGIDDALILYRLTQGGKSRNKLKAAKMTYRTYCYAGYGRLKASFMMFSYMINGIKKYKLL